MNRAIWYHKYSMRNEGILSLQSNREDDHKAPRHILLYPLFCVLLQDKWCHETIGPEVGGGIVEKREGKGGVDTMEENHSNCLIYLIQRVNKHPKIHLFETQQKYFVGGKWDFLGNF